MDIGYIGPGVYILNGGLQTVTQIWIGGPYGGNFNQYGGTNRIELLHLDYGGSYNFYVGEFATTNIYFTGGTFYQRGGVLRPIYHLSEPWNYALQDGINHGGFGFGSAVQLGGTIGPIGLGNYRYDSYTLSNGVFRRWSRNRCSRLFCAMGRQPIRVKWLDSLANLIVVI